MEANNVDSQTRPAVNDSEAIDPRSRSIAEKRAIGLTHGQIADLHNVSTKTVQRTLERPVIEELVRTLQSQMYG